MNVHDVRSLVLCKGCGQPGDKRNMIPTDLAWWHGSCYVMEFGEDRFMKLPASHIGGLTLDDIGIDLMRRAICRDKSSK